MIRSRAQFVWLPLLLMLAVAMAACGGNGPEGFVPEGSGSIGRSPAGFSQEAFREAGPLVPDFTVSTSAGSSFSLRGHRGEIILLYFSFPG